MKWSNNFYDVIKWVAITALPAVNVFLGVVLPAVGVDKSTTAMVLTIVAAADTLIGTLAGISSVQYSKSTKTEGKEND